MTFLYYTYIYKIYNLPGHGSILHFIVSVDDPNEEQSLPPNSGEGLLHWRDLSDSPPPHVTVHGVQSLQGE